MAKRGVKRRPIPKRTAHTSVRKANRTKAKDVRRVSDATIARNSLRRLERSLAAIRTSADSLSASLEALRQEEAFRVEERLARSLVADRVLQELLDLEQAIKLPETPEHLCEYRPLFVAIRNWLSDHLHLEPVAVSRSRVELPGEQLMAYELASDPPDNPHRLVQVEVILCGVKWRGRVIAPPVARLV